MIDINLIRRDTDGVANNLARRGVSRAAVDRLKELDEEWLSLTRQVEEMRAAKNKVSDAIVAARGAEREQMIADMREVSAKLKDAEGDLKRAESERDSAWRALPNVLAEGVPDGGSDNFEIVRHGPRAVPEHAFPPKSYLELGEGNLFNLAAASRVSGSGFAYILGDLARLQIGLVAWVFDTINETIEKDADMPFTPVIPPVLIGETAMAGMGYLGNHAEEVYRTQDDLYLTGTSEQALGPMQIRNKQLETNLPQRFVGYSSCFRREAGSHGKEVRGLKRLHQFEKIEMFSFTRPEDSEKEHSFLLGRQERIMQALELPYRVITLAAGDLGAPAAKTYDIETWIPSEQRYVETHSTSNTTDYQARRLNIRFKDGNRIRHLHMLNGTALAMSRIFIALLENHQLQDGSIAVPKVLSRGHYVPFERIAANK
ncbi:MAG: serine--tRNA ligase [Candidatus Andersenbacteria bacterium CG10_big_fil_rev_8_21_14_0_10_54_11]|uniref:Serine--tRNA ligase n=1 Tax=Candidatus Andersenbacteria bacterium CG10_big_fil_rev_8_21_14_0_10_54_11 TaxID=1974485 RepID=A0A2M6WYL1_9BACT|nr:MAG: serine--tRNA ligase [Candidatus Andersenbacteria bacterium CG10_big_fil_rev_8_21_14_0_10_54_11]